MQNVHPYFIHFPIALLSFGLLCDIISRLLKNKSLNDTGWWATVAGTIAIVAAMITGLIAESTVGHSDAAHQLIVLHRTIEIWTTITFAILIVWRAIIRFKLPTHTKVIAAYLVVAAIATSTMLIGAHYGGKIVYEYGVGGTAVEFKGEHKHEHGVEHDSNTSKHHEH